MKNIIYSAAFLLLMGCAPDEPIDPCSVQNKIIERWQPCVDIQPSCRLYPYQAKELKEAHDYVEKFCKNETYYG